MSQLEEFTSLFPQIDFLINIKPKIAGPLALIASQGLSGRTHLDAAHELKKMLQRAKRDLNRAIKGFKQNKISSEELLEWEWRVHELEEEIKKMGDLGDELDDMDDYGPETF